MCAASGLLRRLHFGNELLQALQQTLRTIWKAVRLPMPMCKAAHLSLDALEGCCHEAREASEAVGTKVVF